MVSTFLRRLDHVLLLEWALFVSCNVNAQNPDTCNNVCSGSNQPLFNMADRTHSMATGNIRENGHALHPESSSWCPYPANLKYRTIDGTCNHPRNLGSAFKVLGRLLPAAYDDGFNSPRRRGVDGLPLPSARNVSLLVIPPVDVFTKFTIALMSWGQWIAHDIVATAVPNRRISCCGPNGGHPPFVTDPDCFPIELPQNDPSFPGVCLSFIRSMAANDSNQVPIKPRKQINTVTSFIDCSQIYGSTPEVEAQVRVPRSYLLRTKNGNFMPESTNSSCMKRQGTDDYCFLAGDFRVNQNPFISAMHTLWLRDHNRIAAKLRLLRPKSSVKEIFQLAREIIIAKNQVITYNAYLPHILGEDAKRWHLSCHTRRSFYNQDLDPSIAVEFATACFRFGHSTISSVVPIGNRSQLLRNQFNRPALVLNLFEHLVAGMVGLTNVSNAHMQTPDRNFVEDISRFLFMNQFTGQSLDLATLNIQRGRDHGIPPYVKWRSFCGLRPLKGFSDTEALGSFASVLGTVYRSVEDIDLFTGMLHEPVDTGILGPTIRCILRIQFFRLKYGDRFFFDNDETNSGFNDEELKSLLKVTLSKVICQNTNIESMPVNAFKYTTKTNPIIPCSVLKEQDQDLSVFARN